MKRRIAIAVLALGFVLLLGTAGASDAGEIGITQAVVRCVLGVLMMFGGFGAVYIIERSE